MSPKQPIQAQLMHLDFRCDRTVVQPEQTMKAFVRRDEIAMHVLERGRLRVIFASGERIELAPHHLMVSWGVFPHRAEWLQKNTIVYCLTIPLSWVLRWQLSSTFICDLLAGRILIEADRIQGRYDQHMMQRWVTLLAEPTEENRRIVLLETEARLRRLAQTGQPGSQPSSGAHSTKVEQAIQLIARQFADPLNVPALAAELHIHPNYLSTRFKQETGQTLSHYLTEYRLAHACSLLVTTADKIIDIAYAAGFGSVSQFHTLFRHYRGCSPRQYRLRQRPPSQS